MKKEGRFKLLISNIIVYGFNQVIVILIPMIMLPIYSRILPDISVYGIGSLTTTISTLASSVATFGMFDAAVRFAFDKKENMQDYHYEICTTATVFMTITSSISVFVLFFLRNKISFLFFGSENYYFMVILASGISLFTVWNTAALIPIRIYNKRNLVLVNSLIKVLATAGVTVTLILAKKYLIAIPMGTMGGLILAWLYTFLIIQYKYIRLKYFNLSRCKEMLKYAAPLMISFISYWVYQSADKIMISNLTDFKEVGIYTIGSKIGSISAVVQNAFASGWAYFAFSTMEDRDQITLISRIFRVGVFGCCILGYLVCAFIYPIFTLFFAKGDYILGSFLCAALFISPLYLTLMQIVGTQLLIKKNAKLYSNVQVLGAAVNIIFNFILIPRFGARGAAAGTLIGYAVPLVILTLLLGVKKKIVVEFKTIITFTITFVVILISTLFVEDYRVNMMIGSAGGILIFISFRKDLLFIFDMFRKLLKNKE